MPAQLQFFDMQIIPLASGPYVPIPFTLGPNWQPNDIRIVFQCCYQQATAIPVVTPPGFTTIVHNTPYNIDVSYRRLQPGDTDTFTQYQLPQLFALWACAIMTVRGVSPSSNPTGSFYLPGGAGSSSVTMPSASSTGGTAPAGSFSVPSAGAVALWFVSLAPSGGSGGTNTSACSVGVPAGWTNLIATDSSGATYTPFFGANSHEVVAKSFSSSGSTGTVTLPYGAENAAAMFESQVFFPAAADVSATGGSASAVPTSANASGGATNVVTASGGNATSIATSRTAFNPVRGYWVSDPLTLPGDPVTGSVIRWAGNTPTGSTAVVETSINNGASWDTAINNRPVPRLKVGDTVTGGVLARITLTRTLATDPAPTMSYLEMQVSNDVGTDELVPIGHGMIDKVTVKTLGGSQGGGSTASGVSSSAVVAKGGGQTGGGTSIKIHVTDLSRAIKRNVWQQPFVVPIATNYGAAVKAMVLNRLSNQTEFAISTTTRVLETPLVYGMDQGGDPWQDIREVAMAIGFECYFDPRGVFVFRPVPDPRIGEPVFVFDENFNPIVAEATKEFTDEQTFNDIIVTGQASSTQNPVSAEAFDNDPASRTYILGDYGRVTQRLTFTTITEQDQAQDAANAVLFNSLGAAETVTVINVPHPALEPGDVVKLKISNVGVDGTYMINSMTTSLSPAEPQQLVCFRQSTNA